MKKREELQLFEQRTLGGDLFSLAVNKPADTQNTKYMTLGHYLKKKKFYQFIQAFKNNMQIELDAIVFSRIVIGVSIIDGDDYLELYLGEDCYLPIAGKQLPMLKREAEDYEISLIDFAHSFDFILNDKRNYL